MSERAADETVGTKDENFKRHKSGLFLTTKVTKSTKNKMNHRDTEDTEVQAKVLYSVLSVPPWFKFIIAVLRAGPVPARRATRCG